MTKRSARQGINSSNPGQSTTDTPLPATHIAEAVLDWFDKFGRKHLPWQQNKSPYRVWISEIMLQQTQVATVTPYYEKFMRRFPDVATLAAASEDDVLAHWSGLGYYARARNLHKCAKRAVSDFNGELPDNIDELVDMPGIGLSTAGAILSLSLGQHHAILDGNVKRVLARYHAVEGWPGTTAVQNRLWQMSRYHTPGKRTADFNQAMMDIGATVCTRSSPDCANCPLATDCAALATGSPTDYPFKKPKKQIPIRATIMLYLMNDSGGVLLYRRPPSGIWGGLWSLPEVPELCAIDDWLGIAGLAAISASESIARFRHTFSHYHLDIDVQSLKVNIIDTAVLESDERVWYNGGQLPGGIAAPVSKILNNLSGELL